jgi:glutathione S-transferase
MSKPLLYIFAISHYCEKARWALDYLNIDYDIRYTPPGLHRLIAKKLGASGSTLPILVTDGQPVQGSAEIINWADLAASTDTKRLTPEAAREQCLEIEKRLDDIAGVHVRRYYYSEALIDHPETVRAIFTENLPAMQKLLVGTTWGLVRKLMIKGMDLGFEQGQESRRIVDGELSWVDEILSDGRQYLAWAQFSRADIAAASLLAPLAVPKEHPTYSHLELPPNFSIDLKNWEDRPSLNWVRDIYAQYR